MHEFNTATANDSQVDIASNPDIVNHTRNRIIDQKSLSCRTTGEVSVFPPPKNPSIGAIELAPQTLLTPAVQEIFTDAASGNT